MDTERWDRIQRLFHEALDMPEESRREFVRSACADTPDIEAEVLDLLAEDRSDGSLLDQDVGQVADAVLAEVPSVPREIGPYRVTRKLGEGGMGVVYLAERDDLHRPAAIKFLRDARLSPQRRERFLREQRILAKLSHPAISRLYDASTLPDGTPYFVMEYVDGLPLTEFCDRHGLSIEDRLRLFAKVCDVVHYAHRQALIHRDLKPSNILALDGGQSGELSVKLLDFGIAKQTDPDEESPTLTQTGLGIMTPAYAAPEQLRGHAVGVFTDVYSLGVVLYQLLTGTVPFDLSALTPFEAAQTVIAGEVERPSARTRHLDTVPDFAAVMGRRAWADLDVLCLTAMHKDPDRRYPTVEALLRDIHHYLDGQPLEARPDSAGYRLGKFVRRNRRAVTSGVAIIVAIATLVTFYTLRLSAARDRAFAEAARTQRIQRFMLDLFEGGDDIVGPEQDLQVSTLIERGVREARVLDGEPAIQAELYQTLGEVSRRMSDLDRAEEMLQAALAQRQELFGDDHPDVAETLMTLGLVRNDRGELAEAERFTREALEIVRTRLPPEHPRFAETLSSLGDVLQSRGDYEEAIRHLEEARRLQEARDDMDGLMATLRILASTYSYAGEYETSDTINRRLLVLVEERLGANHPSYATCLINLASNRRWLGYPKEAEALYREALVINERYHGRQHPTVASNLSLIGASLTDQKRYDEARGYLDEALALREAVYGPQHSLVAMTLNQLARNYLAAGDLDAAEASHLRELAIYRATVGDEHPWTATGLSNMASIHFRREQWELAESTMREAVAIFAAALKPDHVDVAIARIKLGRLLAHRQRRQEALAELTAGLTVLAAQASPSMSWIELARKEIAAIYEALGESDRAAEFRAAPDEESGEGQ
jgi:serine/threonine-protein kinase